MTVVAVTIHLSVLPYADLTLLSSNSIVGIVIATVLSILFLDEKWVMKYDLTALLFIVFGCSTIVLLSNKSEAEFDAEAIKKLLFSVRTVSYLAVCCVMVIIDYLVLRKMLRALKKFQEDANLYDKNLRAQAKKNGQKLEKTDFILPPEEDEKNEPDMSTDNDDEVVENKEKDTTDDGVERSDHELIRIITGLPLEKLKQVSERSVFLKQNIKMPLVFFILGTSLQSGFTTVIVKVVDIFIQTGLFTQHYLFTICLIVTLPPSAMVQVHLLNLAMKYYD